MVYTPSALAAIVAAGIAGCLATALTLNAVTGKPASIVAANWKKHVWSVIFAAPLPWIASLPGSYALSLVLGLAWLILAPSLASKAYFGPKDAPWSLLLTLHGAFGFAALAVYLLVRDVGLRLG